MNESANFQGETSSESKVGHVCSLFVKKSQVGFGLSAGKPCAGGRPGPGATAGAITQVPVQSSGAARHRAGPGGRLTAGPSSCRQSLPAPGVGDGLRQQLGSRLAWTLTASQPSLPSTTSKAVPSSGSRGAARPRREGDAAAGE